MTGFWHRLYDALAGRWSEPVSFTTGVDWTRDTPTEPELTEDIIIADQPGWKPPPAARADRWRPRNTLDP